jgi:hypothetical protein
MVVTRNLYLDSAGGQCTDHKLPFFVLLNDTLIAQIVQCSIINDESGRI